MAKANKKANKPTSAKAEPKADVASEATVPEAKEPSVAEAPKVEEPKAAKPIGAKQAHKVASKDRKFL